MGYSFASWGFFLIKISDFSMIKPHNTEGHWQPRLSTQPPWGVAALWLWWFSCGYSLFFVVIFFLITLSQFSSSSLAMQRATGSSGSPHNHPWGLPRCGCGGFHCLAWLVELQRQARGPDWRWGCAAGPLVKVCVRAVCTDESLISTMRKRMYIYRAFCAGLGHMSAVD